MANKTYTLINKDTEGREVVKTVSESMAIKLMKGRTMSKKWKFEDKKLEIETDNNGVHKIVAK